MSRLILIIFLLSTSAGWGQVSSYFSELNKLPDNQLIEYMNLKKIFGSCSFRRAKSGSSTCKYSIKGPSGERTCITASPIQKGSNFINIIGLVAPSSMSATKKSAHFDNLRASFVNFATADAKAAQYIRSKFLSSSNYCSFSSSNIPSSGQSSLSSLAASNFSFYKTSTNSPVIHCSTSQFSRKIFNSSSCSYSQKDQKLPDAICKTLYGRFRKLSQVQTSVQAPTINVLSAAQAKDFIAQDLVAVMPDLSDSISKVPFEEVVSADTLLMAEFSDDYSNCSSISECQPAKMDTLIATINNTSSNSEYAIDSALTSFAGAQSVTATAEPLNTDVINSYTNYAVKANSLAAQYATELDNVTSVNIARPSTPCALQYMSAQMSPAPSM